MTTTHRRIKHLRCQLLLTQQELALLMDIKAARMRAIEAGCVRPNPQEIYSLIDISNKLGIKINLEFLIPRPKLLEQTI